MRRDLPICLACALMLAPTTFAADAEADLKQRTQSLEQMRDRMQSLDRELARTRSRRDQLAEEVEAAEVRLHELEKDLEAQRSRVAQTTSALRKTRSERTALEQKLASQRALLGRQVRAAYMMGRRGTARLVLRQHESASLQRLLTHFDYFNRARTRAIASIRRQHDALAAIEARQQEQNAALAAAQAEQQRALAALSGARAARLAAVRKLEGRIAGGESELEQLRAGERELVTLITRLKDLLAEMPAGFRRDQTLARQKGRLPWPVRGKLLARYGAPKAGGKLKWAGIWIAAAEGAPVRAVASGRVAYVGRLQRFGLLAVVEHAEGYYTLYGHNAELTRAAGDTIRAGDILGRAGSSGGHEQPGLYFELRKGAQPVDPLEWLGR